jgi:hypothetical protein
MLDTSLAQHVLAAMLSLAPPGHSAYSRTVVPDCDKTCQATRVCADPGTICDAPSFSRYERAYTRQETAQEGLRRYAGIAEAIADVAENLPEWRFDRRELADVITTHMFFESGLRADVQAGVGPAAYGDCSSADPRTGARVKEGTPGARRYCRAGCLMQINVQMLRVVSPNEKLALRDIVGTSPERTRTCITMGARVIAKTRGSAKRAGDSWVLATMQNYGGLFAQARTSTYAKVKKAPPTLPDSVLAQLGIRPDT